MGIKADKRWVSGSGEVSWQTVGKDETTSIFDKRSLCRSFGIR